MLLNFFFLFFHVHQNLQEALDDMQSDEKKTLEASKRLIARLEPLAANLIQSESSSLSHDVLLLTQAILGKKKSLQARTALNYIRLNSKFQ